MSKTTTQKMWGLKDGNERIIWAGINKPSKDFSTGGRKFYQWTNLHGRFIPWSAMTTLVRIRASIIGK